MHFVVDNVACGSKVHGIDDFVVPILFIAVEILGLTAVAYIDTISSCLAPTFDSVPHLSNGRITSRSAERP